MVDAQTIIGMLLEKGTPVAMQLIQQQNNVKAVEKQSKLDAEHIQGVRRAFNDTLGKARREKTPAASVTTTVQEPHSHSSEEKCELCEGGLKWLSRGEPKVESTPHGVNAPNPSLSSQEKDIHYPYTIRELVKNMALLQNHYTDYRCPQCIEKHLMLIEGYAEEGIPMTPDQEEKQRFEKVIQWTRQAQDRTDYSQLIDEVRNLRTAIAGTGHAHPDIHS